MPLRIFLAYFDSSPSKRWALVVQHKSDFEVFELTAASGQFQYNNKRCAHPEDKERCLETVELGSVHAHKVPKLRKAAKEQQVCNDGYLPSQDWALSLLRRCREEDIFEIAERVWEKLQKDYDDAYDEYEE